MENIDTDYTRVKDELRKVCRRNVSRCIAETVT